MSNPGLPDGSTTPNRAGRVRVGAMVAVLLALLFVVLGLVSRERSGGTAQSASSTPPEAVEASPVGPKTVTADELRAVPDDVGHEVYWVGDDPKRSLELTILKDGGVYVRYLPKGVDPGDDRPAHLTVASYPREDAYALVRSGGERRGALLVKDQGGALVTAEDSDSTNAYFAFENVPLLVEVFDPAPGRAFELIQSGAVVLLD